MAASDIDHPFRHGAVEHEDLLNLGQVTADAFEHR